MLLFAHVFNRLGLPDGTVKRQTVLVDFAVNRMVAHYKRAQKGQGTSAVLPTKFYCVRFTISTVQSHNETHTRQIRCVQPSIPNHCLTTHVQKCQLYFFFFFERRIYDGMWAHGAPTRAIVLASIIASFFFFSLATCLVSSAVTVFFIIVQGSRTAIS